MLRHHLSSGHNDPIFWDMCLANAAASASEHCSLFNLELLEKTRMDLREMFDEAEGSAVLMTSVFVGLYEIDDQWYEEYYATLFEDLLPKSAENLLHLYGDPVQPKELTRLVCELSGYSGGAVYNPFAGAGSYIIGLGAYECYFAQEINVGIYEIALLRFMAHGIDINGFERNDSIEQWNEFPNGKNRTVPRLFDLIVATPPFRAPIRNESIPFSTVDEFYIHNGLESLSDSGKLIGVFTPAVLYSSNRSAVTLRKSFLENDLLDTVIFLPRRLFSGTSTDVVILIFSKAKSIPGSIKLVDGTNCYKVQGRECLLDVDSIRQALAVNDEHLVRVVSCDYFISRDYRIEVSTIFINSSSVPAGFKKVELRSIARLVHNPSRRDGAPSPRAITPSHLKGDQFLYHIDIDSLETDENTGHLYYQVDEPVLLISLSQRLKTAYVEASKQTPVMVSVSISSFAITADWVNIPYLCRQLTLLTDNPAIGASRFGVSESAMLDLQIPFPVNPTDQAVIYRAAESEYKMARVREFGLEEMLAAQKKDFILVLRNRKHDINTFVANIRNRVRGLDKYMRKAGLDKGIYSVRQNTTVGDNLNAIIKSLDQMGEYLEHIADESQYGFPVKVDLCDKLSSIGNGINYSVEYKPDLDSLRFGDEGGNECHAYVSFSPRDLDHVILNIVSNANTHGFTDPDITDYRIVVSLLYDKDTDMYVIEFRNNGKPMVEGLDTSRYATDGAKFGPTQGNGHGGAIVKDTVENFGGSMEIVNAPMDPFPVSVIIKLPRYAGE